MTITSKDLVQRGLATVIAALIAIAPAGLAFAQAADTTTVPDTTAPTEQADTSGTVEETPGATEPTGPDARSYTFNPATGLWENAYFTWDPVTKKTTPKTSNGYSYNPSTGRWDTVDWQYNPESGTYKSQDGKKTLSDAPTSSISDTGPGSTNTIDNYDPNCNCGQPGQYSIDQTGPYSNNGITNDNTGTSYYNGFFDANISTTIGSYANSGNASVSGNTNGGSATSGDAAAMLTIINMLQSAWGINGDFSTFSTTIDGDHTGDLVIAPPKTNPNVNVASQPNGTVVNNIDVNAAIDNDIDLQVGSGNASVNKNTKAGNATTGNASAIANVVNMIGTMIAAQKSFIGVINVTGNLTGDILVAEDGLKNLTSGNSALGKPSYNLDLNDSQTINNNITTAAESGSAQVKSNTEAGSAKTGGAQTSIALFNLTGKQVIAKNSVLVFVNVLGEWVGLIVDGAEGQSSAILASGLEDYQDSTSGGTASIDGTGPNSVNEINNHNNDKNSEMNVNSNALINNDINIGAKSGDADVTSNTKAGNATSGNALAAANVLNITQSNFALGGWMGIVFVNVLGDWFGSFGVDTDFGDPVLPTPIEGVNSTPPANNTSGKPKKNKNSTASSGSSPENSWSNNVVFSTIGGFLNKDDEQPARRDKKETSLRDASFLPANDGQPTSNNSTMNLMATASASALVIGALMLAAQRAFNKDAKH